MTVQRKALFSLVTVVVLLLSFEGFARIVWWSMARRAFAAIEQRADDLIRGDPATINFMKEPDRLYGYILKPGFDRGALVVSQQGFAQREVIPVERRPKVLRIAALGESTTQGHDVDKGSYPTYLRSRLRLSGRGYEDIEVINGGVAGWVSEQVALRAENQIVAFNPDIVILYVGWNDFQAYDPYGPVPRVSAFVSFHGGSVLHGHAASALKSVALLSAAYQKVWSAHPTLTSQPWKVYSHRERQPSTEETYRFYLSSLDRIVVAFRRANPSVRLFITTLVGRWPLESDQEFADRHGRTRWMIDREVSKRDAASCLRRFNDLLRGYASREKLGLIDAAGVFDELDRSELQWDFAHMTFEGYELLAEVMYEAIRQAGAVEGEPSARLADLMDKYKREGVQEGKDLSWVPSPAG